MYTQQQKITGEVLETGQALYERVAATQQELEGLRRYEGTYTEDHIDRLRAEVLEKSQAAIEQRRQEAARKLEDGKARAKSQLERARKVDSARRGVALAQLQLIYGQKALSDDPDKLFEAYERAFSTGDHDDRRVIEDLAEGLIETLPNDYAAATFKAKWSHLKSSNVHRLPEEERGPLNQISEVDAAAEYLGYADRYAMDKLARLKEPAHSLNLTAYAHASKYEQQYAGQPNVERVLPYGF
jgi:hypothetical protein